MISVQQFNGGIYIMCVSYEGKEGRINGVIRLFQFRIKLNLRT